MPSAIRRAPLATLDDGAVRFMKLLLLADVEARRGTSRRVLGCGEVANTGSDGRNTDPFRPPFRCPQPRLKKGPQIAPDDGHTFNLRGVDPHRGSLA